MATLQLLEADPARGAVNVSIQPQLTLQFNADLDVSSVHASMVYLTDVTGQTILPADPALLTVTGSTLSFTPQYASGTVSLSPFTTYMVTVTPGVQDVLGHALAFPLTWSFTTGNADGALTLAPTLMDPVNATHVSSADFTPSWTSLPGATSYEVEISADKTFTVLALPLISVTEVTTTGTIGTVLAEGEYFIRVRGRNALGAGPWSDVIVCMYDVFVTANAEPPAYGSLWANPLGFSIVASDPVTGAGNVLPDQLTIQFTTPLPTVLTVLPTLTGSPLYAYAVDTAGATAVWTVGTDPHYLIGTAELQPNTTYTVTFPAGFTDAAGSPLVGDQSFWFTTQYSCLYSTPRQLRLRLGTLADEFTDEALWYYIFSASVDYNVTQLTASAAHVRQPWRDADRQPAGPALSPTIADATTAVTPITVEMARVVTGNALLSAVNERILEISAEGSGSHKVGDYETTHTYNTLEALMAMRDSLIAEFQLSAGCASIIDAAMGSISSRDVQRVGRRNDFGWRRAL